MAEESIERRRAAILVAGERVERRLAAILAADVAGYSRLIGLDEEGTLAALRELRRELIDPAIAEHRGRVVKTTGDGMLVEFASVLDALRVAVAVQREMAERNATVAAERRIEFRVGIHQGDIVVEDGDIFGDGVNIAARLEGMAGGGGICVSSRVQEDVAGRLDLDFEDLGEPALKNIARPVRVYRVVARGPHPNPPPLAGEGEAPAGSGAATAGSVTPPPQAGEGRMGALGAPALALPGKPSIAVLPFQNMSGDPEQEYFADGMVEEITTAIARLPWLFVISRNSSFTYKGQAVDVKRVGRELGVRYVLEGSVRKAGQRVRIAGQLIDTITSAHIWADRFDGGLDSIFELQDRVASSVVGAIEPKLLLAEIERSSRKPTDSLDAYDLYLRAQAQIHRYTAASLDEAIVLAKQALAIDPAYAPAAATVGLCWILKMGQGLPPTEDGKAESIRLAKIAAEAGRDHPDALWMAADSLSVFTGAHVAAMSLIERALALNSNSAHAWNARGWVDVWQGRPEPAIDSFQRAMRLSPLDPIGWLFTGGTGLAHLVARRFEETIRWADRALHEQPRWAMPLRHKAIAYAHLGRNDEASACVRRMLEADPNYTIARWKASQGRIQSEDTLALWLNGLQKAGLPDG